MTTLHEAAQMALEALETLAVPQYADRPHPVAIAIEVLRSALAQQGEPYKDSTSELSVGDSSFESWYATYPRQGVSKQVARDAYAAGMGDPLVKTLAQQGEQPSFSDWEVFAMQEQKQRAEVHRDKLLSMLEELLDALGCGDSAIEIEAGELIDEINKGIDRS